MGELTVTPVTFAVKATTPTVTVKNSSGAQVILVPAPGPMGPVGPAGTGTQVFGETPAGAVDGVNTVFTTAHTFQAASTAVYLNGLREFLGDAYIETSGDTVTFSDPPHTGDSVRID